MKKRGNFTRIFCLYTLCLLLTAASQAGVSQDEPGQSPESVVKALYEHVTFPAGTAPNWDQVKALFHQGALISLRTSRTDITVFTVDGFVQDFINFINQAKVEETGFQEKIIRLKPVVVGDAAVIFVLYEASIPGRGRPPQQGVDCFSLIRQNGRWWIVSIINEIPRPGIDIPEILEN